PVGFLHCREHLGGSASGAPLVVGEDTVSERTLVFVKPDGVRRGLVGEIVSRFEAKGLRIVTFSMRTLDPETADAHYAEHVKKAWYPKLREFITSGPIVAMVLEGDPAIA